MKRLVIGLAEKIRGYRLRLEAKQEQRRKERRRAGYEFAMGDYFAGRASLLELEACTATAGAFGKYDAFDRGIDDAIRKLESMGMTNLYEDCGHA